MKYAVLEINHTPTLIFCSSRAKQKIKEIITPLSQVTRLHEHVQQAVKPLSFP